MYFMVAEDENTLDGPDGRRFYGSVTVGERGQIVVPAQARRDHGIKAGDKLIVLGNAEGIALMQVGKLLEALNASTNLMKMLHDQTATEDRS